MIWKTLLVVVLLPVALRAETPGAYRFVEKPAKTLSLYRGSSILWTLHFDGKEQKPYFHPLRTPSGVDLAGHRPPDHPWHLGLWYSWKYINNANFWDPRERLPNEPRPGVIALHHVRVKVRDDFSATASYELSYRIGEGPAILNESVMLAIAPPRGDGAYWIDWRQTSTAADIPLVFERTKPASQGGPAWGGYAGLAYRCAATLTERRALDANGWENTARLLGHGKPAKWLDFSASVNGQGSLAAGVTLMDHPSNPRSPSPWYVYMDGAIGITKTALLFHEPLKLAPHEKLSLHYRVFVHEGRGQKAALDAEFQQFAKTP